MRRDCSLERMESRRVTTWLMKDFKRWESRFRRLRLVKEEKEVKVEVGEEAFLG